MWILARTASKRPTLMHHLVEDYADTTSCGLNVSMWSRAYKQEPIPEIACVKCVRKAVFGA